MWVASKYVRMFISTLYTRAWSNLYKFNSSRSTHFRRFRRSYIRSFCCYCTTTVVRECKCQLGAAVDACGWRWAEGVVKRDECNALYLLLYGNSYSHTYLFVLIRVGTCIIFNDLIVVVFLCMLFFFFVFCKHYSPVHRQHSSLFIHNHYTMCGVLNVRLIWGRRRGV